MIRFRGMTSFTRCNALGEPFTVYREEPLVSRIDDRFLDCSIYLYQTEDAARDGLSKGGSGFLAAIPGWGKDWLIEGNCPEPDFHHCYAVTNKHVAQNSSVVRLNREWSSAAGSHVSVIPLTANDWFFSRDHDIAVAPIPYTEGLRYLFVAREKFLTEQKARKYDIGIGDEVFTVGRFVNHEGKQRNNPSVRWGHLSMMPVEIVDDPDHPRQAEVCFAIETHTISGYSGSPVFVRPFPTPKLEPSFDSGTGTNTNVLVSVMGSYPASPPPVSEEFHGPWLLGIQKAYIHFYDSDGVKRNTGMACVVPAWHILDLLNTDRMQDQRKDEQRLLMARHEREGTTETAANG
jgi:hypothetical protein